MIFENRCLNEVFCKIAICNILLSDNLQFVSIKFNNKDFLLSCEDGQEEHLEELSLHINEKFNKLKSSLGNIGESKLLLITSITTMDEYFETKKKIDLKKKS